MSVSHSPPSLAEGDNILKLHLGEPIDLRGGLPEFGIWAAHHQLLESTIRSVRSAISQPTARNTVDSRRILIITRQQAF